MRSHHLIFNTNHTVQIHDDVIKWKHIPRYWPFVRGIHRSPVNSPHKGQWRGVLMFSLICVCINGWVNNREAGDLIRYRAHYDVTLMSTLMDKQMQTYNSSYLTQTSSLVKKKHQYFRRAKHCSVYRVVVTKDSFVNFTITDISEFAK